jgi:hypothetical protein
VAKRIPIKHQKLDALEAEFYDLLPTCLKQCADGRWGLFGQNDDAEGHRWLRWPEADRLKEIAEEIQNLRREFGEPNPLCERFLHYCSLRGSNVPGEPKLARAFLHELEAQSSQTSD